MIALGWWVVRRDPSEAGTARIPGDGDRIIVEVLNGTNIDGLANRITRQLRRKGLDVVFYGSAATTEMDSTLIIARRGDTVSALRVRETLGVGTVRSELRLQMFLDVTIVLGRDAEAISVSARN